MANDFSQTGRDMDTFRPTIAPMSGPDDGEERALGSTWFGLSIVLGALLGTLIVAWVYIEDHPVIPVAARHATSALSAPAKPAAAPAPAPALAPTVAPQASAAGHGGFIAVPGPAGTRVFDGATLVGTAPMLYATNAGPHVIRVAIGDKPGDRAQAFHVEVRAFETTAVIATFDSKSSAKRRAPAPPAAKKSR